MAQPGISTLGIKLGYGIGSSMPASFTLLTRINAIGGISLETEQIDASALEDYVTRYVAGRQDTGGSWPITINITDDTIAEWEALIAAYNAKGTDEALYLEVWSPYLTKGFFIKAQPPQVLPMSEMAQNELQTVEISLTIEEYLGMSDKVEPVG